MTPVADEVLAAVVGAIERREPLDDAAEKFSAAPMERVTTADGTTFVVKQVPPKGDWLTRATDGLARARRLWEEAVLSSLEPAVDHAVVGVERSDTSDVIVMRDVSASLVPSAGEILPSTARWLAHGLAAMHAAGEHIRGSYCTVAARLALFDPAVHAGDQGPNPHPLRDAIVEGWSVFAEVVPDEVVQTVFAVHRSPDDLAGRLEAAAPPTLLHGDAKPENLGLADDKLVAIDWGELTGIGPAETDVAWFAIQSTWRAHLGPDALFQFYAEKAVRPLDEEALDLACVGALAQMGFKLALRSVRAPDEAVRVRGQELLGWWTARVQAALERTGFVASRRSEP